MGRAPLFSKEDDDLLLELMIEFKGNSRCYSMIEKEYTKRIRKKLLFSNVSEDLIAEILGIVENKNNKEEDIPKMLRAKNLSEELVNDVTKVRHFAAKKIRQHWVNNLNPDLYKESLNQAERDFIVQWVEKNKKPRTRKNEKPRTRKNEKPRTRGNASDTTICFAELIPKMKTEFGRQYSENTLKNFWYSRERSLKHQRGINQLTSPPSPAGSDSSKSQTLNLSLGYPISPPSTPTHTKNIRIGEAPKTPSPFHNTSYPSYPFSNTPSPIPNTPSPVSNTQFPSPNTPSSFFNPQFSFSNTTSPIHNTPSPIPNTQSFPTTDPAIVKFFSSNQAPNTLPPINTLYLPRPPTHSPFSCHNYYHITIKINEER